MLFFICLFLFSYLPFQAMAEHYLIIADGQRLPTELVDKWRQNKIVIALDGAINFLQDPSLHPHIILGDFDSIKNPEYWGIKQTFSELTNSSEPYLGNFDILIVPAKDQNYTDLEKALKYCDAHDAESITVVNALGGRLDHTLGNIGLLRKYYDAGRNLCIRSEKERLRFIRDAHIMLTGKPGDRCAILGYPEAVMTSKGLAYNGDNYPLRLGIQESICNTLAEPEASIEIEGEALIID